MVKLAGHGMWTCDRILWVNVGEYPHPPAGGPLRVQSMIPYSLPSLSDTPVEADTR